MRDTKVDFSSEPADPFEFIAVPTAAADANMTIDVVTRASPEDSSSTLRSGDVVGSLYSSLRSDASWPVTTAVTNSAVDSPTPDQSRIAGTRP